MRTGSRLCFLKSILTQIAPIRGGKLHALPVENPKSLARTAPDSYEFERANKSIARRRTIRTNSVEMLDGIFGWI